MIWLLRLIPAGVIVRGALVLVVIWYALSSGLI